MAELIVERDGAIATVTFNRPEAMNALSRSLRLAFASAMASLEADGSIKVVILTGAGDRAFTAGLDLKELGLDPTALDAASATAPALNPIRALESCSKPVIGAINGAAITGGFEVALACDVLVASRRARFADTHARVGIMPGWGLSQKLSRLVGPFRAKELSLTGNFVDAETAAAWGLVNRVVEPDDLMPAVRKLAADMAQVGLRELVDMKRLIDDGYALSLDAGLALEQTRSKAHNDRVTPGEVEARRDALMARSRRQ